MRLLNRPFRHVLSSICVASVGIALTACGDNDAVPAHSPEVVEEEVQERSLTPAEALLDMAARHAQEVLLVSPELATSLGVSEEIAGEGFLSRLGGYGFAANQRAREMNERFLQELRSIDHSKLSGDALITYEILNDAYRVAARRNQFGFGGAVEFGAGRPNSGDAWAVVPYMVTQLTGPHLYLPRMLQTEHPLETRDDVEAYLSRLEAMGRAFDEVIETIGADAALGVMPPDFVLEGAVNAIGSLTQPAPGDHPLVATLKEKMEDIETLTDPERGQYATAAAERIEAVVYPAYARLSATLEALVAQSSSDAGVWRLGEEGEAYYQFVLDAYGGGGMNGDEVHELGLAEVARITAEMDGLLQSIGLAEGTVGERMQQLAAREDNVFANTDEGRAALLALLREQVAEIMALSPDWFGALPTADLEVRRIPVYEQDSSAGGYYSSAPLDGSRPGIYWINLKDTGDNPIHSLRTLTHHEAVPGHHFQISLAQEKKGMPLLRNMLSYSEYAEGWALYAEKLAKEMGVYEGRPEEDLGRLQAEIFRAARLVVDSGLHAKRWTREQAIDYMVGVTGETRASITREIERYAAVPGQACSYKLGMVQMEALRAKAEAELGDDFDIKDYHTQVLDAGAAPLGVLEAKINRWIASEKG